MNGFLELGSLLSFAGSAAAVTAVTQVLKQYIKIDPKKIALIAAGFIVFGVWFLHFKDFMAEGVFLCLLNWILVAGASTGVFEHAVKPIETIFKAKKDNTQK